MFKLELDKKWLSEITEEVQKSVADKTENYFEHAARGIVSDLVNQAIKEELKKPEYTARIQEIAREMIVDRDAKEIVRRFLFR